MRVKRQDAEKEERQRDIVRKEREREGEIEREG